MADLNWNILPGMEAAGGLSEGYRSGLSNAIQMMSQLQYRQSEMNRNNAMAGWENARPGLAQMTDMTRMYAPWLRANMQGYPAQMPFGMDGQSPDGSMPGGQMSPGMQMPPMQQPPSGPQLPPGLPPGMQQMLTANQYGAPSGQSNPYYAPQGGVHGGDAQTSPQSMPGQSQQPSMSIGHAGPYISPDQGQVSPDIQGNQGFFNAAGNASPQAMAHSTGGGLAATDPNQGKPVNWFTGTPQDQVHSANTGWGDDMAATARQSVGISKNLLDRATTNLNYYDGLLADPGVQQNPYMYNLYSKQRDGASKAVDDANGKFMDSFTKLSSLMKGDTTALSDINKYEADVANNKLDPKSLTSMIQNYENTTGKPFNIREQLYNFGLNPKDYSSFTDAVKNGQDTWNGKSVDDITGGAQPYKMPDGSIGFVKDGNLLTKVDVPASQAAQDTSAQKQAQTSYENIRAGYIKNDLAPYEQAATSLIKEKATAYPGIAKAQLDDYAELARLRQSQANADPEKEQAIIKHLQTENTWYPDLYRSMISRNYQQADTGAANISDKETGRYLEAMGKKEAADKVSSEAQAHMLALSSPRLDSYGQPIDNSIRVTLDKSGNPKGLPADVAAYNTEKQRAAAAQQDHAQANELMFQEHQKSMRPQPTKQPTGVGNNGGASPTESTHAALQSTSPIVRYLASRQGEKCTGMDCGTGLETFLGIKGKNTIQALRDSSTVKPNADGTYPEGTGIWFGGKTASQRHYVVAGPVVNGRQTVAEVRNSGPSTGYHIDTTRYLDDVMSESTHKGWPVKGFKIPQAGMNAGDNGVSFAKGFKVTKQQLMDAWKARHGQ